MNKTLMPGTFLRKGRVHIHSAKDIVPAGRPEGFVDGPITVDLIIQCQDYTSAALRAQRAALLAAEKDQEYGYD